MLFSCMRPLLKWIKQQQLKLNTSLTHNLYLEARKLVYLAAGQYIIYVVTNVLISLLSQHLVRVSVGHAAST